MTTTMGPATTADPRRPRRTPATTGLTPARFALAKAMKEERPYSGSLLSHVVGACRSRGLVVAHFRTSLQADGRGGVKHITAVAADGEGYPDCTIMRGHSPMWRELKSFTGVLSDAQRKWIDDIKRSGGDAGVWTPVEWFNGTIDAELDALVRRAA